ncbi:hypothetical protein [Escherichia coli]|uniref:hypothetical protein n=1 Tax=Escherichia coli TaxID=562 RepID=UPI003C7090A8
MNRNSIFDLGFLNMNVKEEYKRKFHKGLSLIETAIVLTLSAVVISTVLFYYNLTKERQSISEGTKAVQSVVAAVNKLYSGRNDEVPSSNDANFMQAISSLTGLALNEKGNTLILPTGNGLQIWGVDGYPRTYAVEIYESSPSKSACIAYATLDFGSLMKRKTKVAQGDFTINDSESGGALTPAEATKQCVSLNYDPKTGKSIKIRYFLGY